MIFSNSIIECGDNSGGDKTKCINVNGNSKFGKIGSQLTVILLRGNILKKLVKKKKYRGYISCLKRNQRRLDGTYMLLDTNKIFLFERERHKFIGTRAFGCLSKELKDKKKDFQYKRIFSTIDLVI
jgi:ribosomal protein L14